jgi:Cu(I)/Ag(I) efflux system membrane protein CusA/SilA
VTSKSGRESDKGTPVLVRDIARRAGPDERRGLTELNGEGEVVSGIAMARYGQNAGSHPQPEGEDW